MSLPLTLHVLAAVIWVGGMFFAHMILRPVADALETPVKVRLLHGVLSRFFRWVWVIVVLQPATGYWMIVEYGGFDYIGLHIQLMQLLAWLMIAVFLHIYFLPFRKADRMLREKLIPEAGLYLLKVRPLIALNLAVGLLTIATAAFGRYGF